MKENILFVRRLKEYSMGPDKPILSKTPLGTSLRLLRTRNNMRLNVLADLAGIDMATLSRIENNKMVGTLQSYINIGQVFGLSLSELFFELESL